MGRYSQGDDGDSGHHQDVEINTEINLERNHGDQSTLVLIDPKPLTRESFAILFSDLSKEFSVLCLSSPDELASVHSQVNTSGVMLLLNIGTLPADDESVQADIVLIRREFEHEPIMLLGDLASAGRVLRAFRFGVQGYLPTTLRASVAIEALRLVRAGGTYVPLNAVAEAVESLSPNLQRDGNAMRPANEGSQTSNGQPSFTVRQLQVLDFLRKGAPNKIIAHELNMKESTVKVHIRHIMKKCQASNRTQAALYADKIG